MTAAIGSTHETIAIMMQCVPEPYFWSSGSLTGSSSDPGQLGVVLKSRLNEMKPNVNSNYC